MKFGKIILASHKHNNNFMIVSLDLQFNVEKGKHYSAIIIMVRTSSFQWNNDDDDVHFVLDQHA
jgi:hypothetical protein